MRTRSILALLLVLGLAVGAAAQTKVSGTAQCGKPEAQHSIPVGDRPNHVFAISQAKCTWTKPLEIAGIQSKEGVSTIFAEIMGNTSREREFYVDTMANGDKGYVRVQSTGTVKDGVPQTGEGTWTYVGGTGKLKGIKGKGTVKGKYNPDGTSTWEVEGEYTLP